MVSHGFAYTTVYLAHAQRLVRAPMSYPSLLVDDSGPPEPRGWLRRKTSGPRGSDAAFSAPRTITTPDAPWHYGDVVEVPSPTASSDLLIQVEGLVERGDLCLALVLPDGRTLVDERRLGERDEPYAFRVALIAPAGTTPSLVIRTGESGHSCQMTLDSIATRTVDASRIWDEVPLPPRRGNTDWHLSYGGPVVGSATEQLRRLALLREPRATVTVPWFGGDLVLQTGSEVAEAVATSGTYEPGVLFWLERLLARGARAINAGGHIGVLATFIAHVIGTDGAVVAVEPSDREFELLRRNSVNRAQSAPITTVRAALSSQSGDVAFSISPNRHSGHGHIIAEEPAGGEPDQTCIRVATVTGDEMASAHLQGRVDAVILDVEGHEVEALMGFTATFAENTPIVFAEANGLDAARALHDTIEAMSAPGMYEYFLLDTGAGEMSPWPNWPSAPGTSLVACPAERAPVIAST